MSKTKQGGFTLIELLVVVAIISLLAAIAIPNFMGRLRIARMTKAEAEIKSIEQAVEMFYTDTGYMPFWALDRTPDRGVRLLRTFYDAFELYSTPMLSAILMTTRVYAEAGLFRGGVSDMVQRNYMPKGIPRDPWKEPYFYSERFPLQGGRLTRPASEGWPTNRPLGNDGVMWDPLEIPDYLPQIATMIADGRIDLDYYIYSKGEDQEPMVNPFDEFATNDDISNWDVDQSYQKTYRQ